MDICTHCKEEIKIYACLDVNGIEELCCQDCHDDLWNFLDIRFARNVTN